MQPPTHDMFVQSYLASSFVTELGSLSLLSFVMVASTTMVAVTVKDGARPCAACPGAVGLCHAHLGVHLGVHVPVQVAGVGWVPGWF